MSRVKALLAAVALAAVGCQSEGSLSSPRSATTDLNATLSGDRSAPEYRLDRGISEGSSNNPAVENSGANPLLRDPGNPNPAPAVP